MKHRDLIQKIKSLGAIFHREGGNHEIYIKNGRTCPVPRHKEINEITAKKIISFFENN